MATSPITEAAFGWLALNNKLNEIIDRVNIDQPLEGDGIRIIDTAAGKLISAAQNPSSANQQDPANQASLPTQPSTGGTSIDQITVTGVKWMNLGVVDPVSCEQSTFSVLVNTGIASDTATFNLQGSILAPST